MIFINAILSLVKQPINYIVAFSFCFPLLIASNLYGLVNIEALKMYHKTQHEIQFSWNENKGKTTTQKLNLNYSLNYIPKFIDNLHSFLYLEYNYSIKDDIAFVNNGLIHYRNTLHIKNKFYAEFFLQNQWESFSELENRYLIGVGARMINPFNLANDTIKAIGSGLMYENEKYTLNAKSKSLRSTSYITIQKKFNKISIFSTNYYQPQLGDFSNYRLLSHTTFRYTLNKNAYIALEYELSYRSNTSVIVEKLTKKTNFKFGFKFL